MNTKIDLQSKTIDYLRFPLTILVIFIHLTPNVNMQDINYSSLTSMDIYVIISSLISHVFAQIAVPSFFVFSGFLFFYKMEAWSKGFYIKKIKSRFRSLVIPYFLWNIIFLLLLIVYTFIKNDGSYNLLITDLTDKGWLSIFWNYTTWGGIHPNILGWTSSAYGPILLPLWFLRDLILVVFISPLIFYWIKYTKFLGVIILAIFFYTKIWFVVPGISFITLLSALFFFSLGAYFGIYKKNLITSFRKGGKISLFIALVMMLLSVYYDNNPLSIYFLPLYVVFGTISIINIASYFIENRNITVNSYLSKTSFFVYVTHNMLILAFLKKTFSFILPVDNAFFQTIQYFLIPLLCMFICLCIYYTMNKFTPRLLNILMGSR